MSLSLPASSLQRSGFYSLHFKSHGPEGLQELGKKGVGGAAHFLLSFPRLGPVPRLFIPLTFLCFP